MPFTELERPKRTDHTWSDSALTGRGGSSPKKVSASNAQAQLPRACACLLFECRISMSTQTHTVRACAFRNSRSVSLALRVQGLQVHVQEVTPARELAESAALDSRGRARHETPQGKR
jgi:hypothetical protein